MYIEQYYFFIYPKISKKKYWMTQNLLLNITKMKSS